MQYYSLPKITKKLLVNTFTAVFATILILVIAISSASADETPESIEKIFQSADTEKKLVIAVFSTQWCKWCLKMKREVFETDLFSNYASGSYVTAFVDADQSEMLVSQFKVDGFPTTLILNADKSVVAKIEGFKPLNEFIEILKKYDKTSK
ncbi:MAG: thioredoxin family protein [Candidatus Riflebacteria bacterium]|nr:thioredoxin family protein [Candidatus Riflebacteria bacterium]